MLDPGPALQIAYVALLSSLTVDGTPVPIWADQAPDNQGGSYLIFQRGDTLPKGTKNAQNDQIDVTIDCLVRLDSGLISEVAVDNLAQAVLTVLFPAYRQCALNVPGVSLWQSIYLGTRPIPIQTTGASRLTRRQLRVRHQLESH